MLGLIMKFASSAGGILIALSIVVAIAGFGGVIAHKLDEGKYQKLVAAQAQAAALALTQAQEKQKVFDNIALSEAQKERDEQAARATQSEASLREVGNHVSVQTITRSCVPLGFVRLLDAAAYGRSAASLPLPAGKSDGSCAPVDWNGVARSVVSNYSTSQANAIQLNHLIDFYRQTQKAR